jgi:predicted metal-binding protein
MPLLICRTCPRYDPAATGDFGRALTAAIAEAIATEPAGADVPVRGVQCLGGCPDHGVAAVDGPGKARIRFSGLAAGHVPALLTAVAAYEACPSGAPEDWDVPAELARRISGVTRKRDPRHR